MPRPQAHIRSSVRFQGKSTRTLELIRQPIGSRYWVRLDGKRSARLPEAIATEIADRLRWWVVLRWRH